MDILSSEVHHASLPPLRLDMIRALSLKNRPALGLVNLAAALGKDALQEPGQSEFGLYLFWALNAKSFFYFLCAACLSLLGVFLFH